MFIRSNFSATFDIEDPFAHIGTIVILEDPSFTVGNLILDLVPLNRMVHTLAHEESIDAILDEQIIFDKDGGPQCFLVCWRGRLELDYTWIASDEL